MNKPILYTAWICPYAQRAWMALLEKGIDFVHKEENLRNKSAELLAVNPRGLVPALVHKKGVVYESLIVCEYIDETWAHQGPRLYPPLTAPLDRARAKMNLDFIDNQVLSPLRTEYLIAGPKPEILEGLGKKLNELFSTAASQSGPYFNGDEFGIIDIALAPFVRRIEIMEKLFGTNDLENVYSERFYLWWNCVKNRATFGATIASDEDFLSVYQKMYFSTKRAS